MERKSGACPDLAGKLAAANACLATFAPGTLIERRHAGWYVCWIGRNGKFTALRWATLPGSDFYPTWSKRFPRGGTSTKALSQLIRWLQGRPVLPISTWRYWASETMRLLPEIAVTDLLRSGYPEHVNCVLCQQQIAGDFDWWSKDDDTGPCCGWRSGCEQKARPSERRKKSGGA
jgi:hypothetical protein